MICCYFLQDGIIVPAVMYDLETVAQMRGQDAKIFTPSEQNEQDMSTTEGQLDGFGDGVRRQKDDVYIGRWRKCSTCRKYR